jgi:MscS family membrane protein
MRKTILFYTIALLLFSFNLNAQKSWNFANSTPRKLVKSHFYYVEKEHRDLNMAIYTFQSNSLKANVQKIRVRELYEILKKLDLKNISNKRKGISGTDKYYLLPKEKKIYLVRIDKSWYYSIETINNIPSLYDKYVLKIDKKNTKKNAIITADITIPKKAKPELNLSTPYNTVLSHILFTSDSLFDADLAAQCIKFSPADTAQKETLAIKLSQIFYGSKKHLFNLSEISKDTFYLDSATNSHIYYPNKELKELFLVKYDDEWKYSITTSKLIESVHESMYGDDADEIFSFGDQFKRILGENRNIKIANLYLWQVVMLLFFLGIFIFVIVFNKLIIKKIFNKLSDNKRLIKNVYPLINMLILFVIAKISAAYGPAFEFPISTNHIFLKSIDLLVIFLITAASIYTVNIFTVVLTKEEKYDTKFGLVYFISLIIKLIIFVVSLVLTIKALDYDLVSVLTGLSIGGFAIALGAQDTVKNFFGSLMIFADHPFSVGDWIDAENVSGTVEQIGLRSTRIRTFYNSLVTIPNSKLSDNNIDNMGKRKYRRYKGNILIKYDTPTDVIELFIDKIREEIKNTDIIRQDFNMVYINNFDKYGLEILVYIFFIVPDWNEEMRAKHDLIAKILKFKEELGIEFVRVPLFEGDKA